MSLEGDVAEALRQGYGIEPSGLEATERGKDFAATVFRVSIAGGPRYVVKVRPADAPRDIAAAIAAFLADAGVPGVVAPIRSRAGGVTFTAASRSITVYPFVEGTIGIEMAMPDEAWRSLGRFARRLHETSLPADLADAVPRETYTPPEVESIAMVDAAVAAAPPDVPASASDDPRGNVIDAWRRHRTQILEVAARAEALGAELGERALPLVTCHADMHTGNLILAPDGEVRVIDWDEVVLAPRERDLMFVVGGGISTALVSERATALFLEGYGPVAIDQPALSYYRHAWAVQDVGGYARRVLLDDSADDAQRADAANILVGLFEPGEIVDLATRGW